MIDVLATFSPGIPIGAINIVGFGGGVYRHMTRPPIDKAFAQLQSGDKHQIGASLSGVVYEPDPQERVSKRTVGQGYAHELGLIIELVGLVLVQDFPVRPAVIGLVDQTPIIQVKQVRIIGPHDLEIRVDVIV